MPYKKKNCTLEIYIILLANVTSINSITFFKKWTTVWELTVRKGCGMGGGGQKGENGDNY